MAGFRPGRIDGERHLAHERAGVAARQQRKLPADGVEHGLEPYPVGLGEVLQHVTGDAVLVAGMTDTETDAAILGPHMGVDTAQTVMARVSAAALDPQLAGGQIQLVVKHHHVLWRNFVEPRRRRRRAPGVVHVGHRFEDQYLAPGDRSLGRLSLKARAIGTEAVMFDDGIDGHEPDVVTVRGISRTRIAEPHHQ